MCLLRWSFLMDWLQMPQKWEPSSEVRMYWFRSCGLVTKPESLQKMKTNGKPSYLWNKLHIYSIKYVKYVSHTCLTFNVLDGTSACASVMPILCPVISSIQNTDKKKRLESVLIQCVSGDCLSSSDSQNGCRFRNRRTHPQRTKHTGPSLVVSWWILNQCKRSLNITCSQTFIHASLFH